MSLVGGFVFPSSSSTGSDNLGSLISQSLSDSSKERIACIANDVKQLTDVEKLLLYLQLPSANSGSDPHKMKGIGVTKKADVEMAQTYAWIQTHLEEDPTVSLPKQEVYEDYRLFAVASKFEPMCVADFGKAMKYIFPAVKPRRLGQRGNSKYCYSGLKKKVRIDTPCLPSIDLRKASSLSYLKTSDDDVFVRIVLSWAEKLTANKFINLPDLATFLVSSHRIDPEDLKVDPIEFFNGKSVGREQSKKKRSASSSSCPKLADTNTNSFMSIVTNKVPIRKLSPKKVQFPQPSVPSKGPKKIKPRTELPSTDGSLMSDDSFDLVNGSFKRRHSASAPTTLVSSPQLDVQSNKFYGTVTQSDNSNLAIGYVMKQETEDLTYFHQYPGHQSSQLVQSPEVGEARFGEYISQEAVREGGTLISDDGSDHQISQLRKLLEKNLPQKVDTIETCATPLQGFSDLRENMQRRSVSMGLLPFQGESCPVTMGQKFGPSQVNESEAAVSYFNRETQYPSVPVSPNTRRNDFTFQPIPTSSSDIVSSQNKLVSNFNHSAQSNMETNLSNDDTNSPVYHYNQQSVAVGTSEPPSGTNSPFLSPRETPTPVNRSRNDSGHSSLSYMRQTPYTVVDSGVSSIASSPFISPQTTPIPHRLRTGSGHITRTGQNLRTRHSSGPGIPSFIRNMSMDTIAHFQTLPNGGIGENGWDKSMDSSRGGKMINVGRHRHVSSPYSLNNHYVDEMKNYFRSQSVPAAREGFGEKPLQSVPENCSMSKNDEFDQSSPNAEPGGVMNRDVMVSGMGTNQTWNQDCQGRRNVTGSLDITPESDELQTAIEDLRDFDTDYSCFEQLMGTLSEPVTITSDLA